MMFSDPQEDGIPTAWGILSLVSAGTWFNAFFNPGAWPSILLFWAIGLGIAGIVFFVNQGYTLPPRIWRWCQAKYVAYRAKHENNPKRIMARCKEQFKDAQKRRIQMPIEEAKRPDIQTPINKIDEVVGFDQAGENLLEFLSQLFGLVGDIDGFTKLAAKHGDHRTRSEAIYSEVSAGQLIKMLGIDSFDQATLEQWRKRAQTIIEAIVLYFDELPAHVAAANIYHKALQIKGFQEHLAKMLPKTTSSTGIIAELETGQLQTRLLDELMGKTPSPAPIATRPHLVEQTGDHLAGGGQRIKK